MAIRILTEEDKQELKRAIAEAAEGGAEVDLLISAPIPYLSEGFHPSAFQVNRGSLNHVFRKAHDEGAKPVGYLVDSGGSPESTYRDFCEIVHIYMEEAYDPDNSRVVLDFTFRREGKFYSCSLISQGESYIANNQFTGFEMQAVEPGGSADLTGYATEAFVEDKIAEATMGGGEVDLLVVATWPFENAHASSFVVGAGSLDQLRRRAHEEVYNPVVYMQYDDNNEYRVGRNHYKAVHVSAFNGENTGFPEESRIVLDFCFRQSGKLWTFSLVSQGEDNIAGNRFTGYEYTVLQEGSGNADLTGYATEEFVRNKIAEAELGGEEVDLSGYAQKSELPTRTSQLYNDSGFLTKHQDISGKLDADKLPEAVNTALAQAKASGEFDGDDGYSPVRGKDYWTAADIAQIKSYVDEAILGGAW